MAAIADAPSLANASPKWMIWTGRVLSALIVALLLMSATMKLSKSQQVVEGFSKLGYPESSIVPIGVTEVACAILYAIPQTAVLGAILVTGYLGGATATHVIGGEPWFSPVVIGVIAWIALYLRDRRIRDLAPWRRL